MKRELGRLNTHRFDVAIIGGGIYGAALAWEAVLRGLSVALVEKGDFGAATSANSLKTVHGGLRYLQQANLKRMRESIRERATLLRIAPHLVHPLPFLMPTYGHGVKGPEAMRVALWLDRMVNRFTASPTNGDRAHAAAHTLPPSRVLSAAECARLLPQIDTDGLTGGALWYDAQMFSSERLTLAFLVSAETKGAVIANYVEATGFLTAQDRVTGIELRDKLSGDTFTVEATTTINAAGPWVDRVLAPLDGRVQPFGIHLAQGMNVVLRRALFDRFAVGLAARRSAANSGRLFFVVPWRGRSMIGTIYRFHDGVPDDGRPDAAATLPLLTTINAAYPAANLSPDDVAYVHTGLVPVAAGRDNGQPERAGQYRIRDHRQDGIEGLISVLGVKYTTARDIAERVVDRVFALRGQEPPASRSAETPLAGAPDEPLATLQAQAAAAAPPGLSTAQMTQLVHHYGTRFAAVLAYYECDDQQSAEQALLQAKTMYAVEHEMAQTLADVLVRRTGVGAVGRPPAEAVTACAEAMAATLDWSPARVDAERRAVDAWYAQREGPWH